MFWRRSSALIATVARFVERHQDAIAGLSACMRRVLATEHGGELYGQREAIIEPVFTNTKFNRGIDRFRRRGRAALRTEWRLIMATHNLLKVHRHALSIA